MTNSLLQSQLKLILAVAVLLCVMGHGKSQTQSPARVLQDLLARYGDNATITVPQLRSLLARLSQVQSGSSNVTAIIERPSATTQKSNSSKVRTKMFSSCVLAT